MLYLELLQYAAIGIVHLIHVTYILSHHVAVANYIKDKEQFKDFLIYNTHMVYTHIKQSSVIIQISKLCH